MDVSLVCYDSSDMSSDECCDSDDFLGLRTPRPSQLDSYPGLTYPTARRAEVVDQSNSEASPANPESSNHGTGIDQDRRDVDQSNSEASPATPESSNHGTGIDQDRRDVDQSNSEARPATPESSNHGTGIDQDQREDAEVFWISPPGSPRVDQINPGGEISPDHPASLNHGTGMEDRRDSVEVVRSNPPSPRVDQINPGESIPAHGSYISQELSLVPVNKAPKKYTADPKSLPAPMQTFLCYVKGYFTKPVNLERQRPAVTHSTFNKALERILGFLGFARDHLHLALTPDVFLRMGIIEDYLTYLKVERKLSSSTISNHAASLIYCAKYLHREFSPEYTDVTIIRRLRGQVATFQRQARGETARTKEDLEEQNRWLDWEEIVSCVSLQRERVDMARSGLARALECADLLLLSLYILIPPSRGQEVRTLEIVPSTLPLTRPELAGRNLVRLEEDGGATFRFQDYKTVKSYGVDTTSLQKEHQLSLLLKEYLQDHRPKLATASESKDFLLL